MTFIKQIIKIGFVLSTLMVLLTTGLLYYNMQVPNEINNTNNSNITTNPISSESPDIELKNEKKLNYNFEMRSYSLNNNVFNSQYIESKILKEVNNYRKNKGLNKLEEVNDLKKDARLHSKDMAIRDFYSHQNPDGEGPKERIGDLSYCSVYSENIHKLYAGKEIEIYSTGEETTIENQDKLVEYMIKDWKASEGHNKNLIDKDVEYSGVGTYIEQKEEKLIVYVTHKMCG